MKIKKILVSLAALSLSLCFGACSENPAPESASVKPPVSKASFQLTIENPQKVIQKGEKVTYKATLTNLTEEEYSIFHGDPLIGLYIRPKEGDPLDEAIESVAIPSKLTAHGVIEKTLTVEALEPGEYVLKSFANFSIGKKDIFLTCDDVFITVTDGSL